MPPSTPNKSDNVRLEELINSAVSGKQDYPARIEYFKKT